MKMIQAVIRPEKESAVAYALAKANYPALTKWDVVGRGKQKGVQVGNQVYDELAKSMFMIVLEDEQVEPVMDIFRTVASTGFPGDGKVFVSPVETAYTIRTGAARL